MANVGPSIPPMPMQAPPECHPAYRYPAIYPQPQHPHLMPSQVPNIHHPSSAFCAIPPQPHNDLNGKYSLKIVISLFFLVIWLDLWGRNSKCSQYSIGRIMCTNWFKCFKDACFKTQFLENHITRVFTEKIHANSIFLLNASIKLEHYAE